MREFAMEENMKENIKKNLPERKLKNDIAVTIQDMMECREVRAFLQRQYIDDYSVPVISFCMNIPGPVKTNDNILHGFESGKRAILSALSSENITVNATTEFHEKTGDELILSVSAPAELLKNIAIKIEESHPFGRLFDIDVIDVDGQKLSRNTFRKCIICDRQAQECARSRRHTVDEMFAKINEMLSSIELC